MKSENKKPKDIKSKEDIETLPKVEQMKYEIAEELDVLDKVFSTGWKSLSAKESGRIGGILASRKKQQNHPTIMTDKNNFS